MSRCSRFGPDLGGTGGPPHVISGPVPSGARIAVSSSWSQTSGHPSAALQKRPTSRVPSQVIDPRRPQPARKRVPRLDQAELVALGIGEHDMGLVRSLADVDVPGAERDQPLDRLLLIVQGRGRQVEVEAIGACLADRRRHEQQREPGAIGRHERDVVVAFVPDVPAQRIGPEARLPDRIVRREAEMRRAEIPSRPASSDLPMAPAVTARRRHGHLARRTYRGAPFADGPHSATAPRLTMDTSPGRTVSARRDCGRRLRA